MKNFSLFLMATFFLLPACKKETARSAHDVAWYVQHGDERAAMLSKCRNNPGELKDSPDCVNSAAAEEQGALGSKDGSIPHL